MNSNNISNEKFKKIKDKCEEDVYNFLNKFRTTEENNGKPTHLSYGKFNGKFILCKENYKLFMDLYIKAITAGVTNLCILETQKELAPIIVDIDLEIPLDDYKNEDRLYTSKMIKFLVNKYLKIINKYLHISKSNQIFILEKCAPTMKETYVKDGFHIMFPDIVVNSKMRHLIRHDVVAECKLENLFENFSNSPEKIIDKAVVSSNAWFLYGSKKPGGNVYILTKIFNDLQVIYDNKKNPGDCELKDIINKLSLQQSFYKKSNITPLIDKYAESDIEAECEKNGLISSIKSEIPKHEIPLCKEGDIRRGVKFTNLLSDKRSEDFHDWLKVGLALHNIDDSLLYTWIDFSQRCSKKYKEGECEKNWKNMKNPNNGNALTIRSLAYWAKQDNPKLFAEYIKEEFKLMMMKSLDGNLYYLAKSVYAKYSDRFVCSSIKNNIWWEFKNHRWNRIEDGYTLKLLFSEDFANEYTLEIIDISNRVLTASGWEKEDLQRKRTLIDKISQSLMNTNFKKTLLEECKPLFYDGTFEQKLDSNNYLIGFENGVYDLDENIFRDGRPDDNITLSTKHNYTKWSEKNPLNKQIFGFFETIFPNEAVRKYFINALSTCVSGETKEEKLYILTGSGSNGKSLTMDLMFSALGDYYMSCPISIITRKRGQSNETSPEKVRMKGKHCGVFQEADDGEKVNVGVMKEFTGGDKVLVRDLFKGSTEMIEFKPQMKFFLTCNQLPPVPSNDDGTWRRLRVIEFISKFVDKDPTGPNEFLKDNTLKQKIEQWGATLISWLIHIYQTEYKSLRVLEDPEEVMIATTQYKMTNDFYTEYINLKLVKTDNIKDKILIKTLTDDFRDWITYEYKGKKFDKNELIKILIKQFGHGDKKYIYNIKFDDDNDEKKIDSNNKSALDL